MMVNRAVKIVVRKNVKKDAQIGVEDIVPHVVYTYVVRTWKTWNPRRTLRVNP